MSKLMRIFILVFSLFSMSVAQARLEVCNQTDLVLMAAIGYDTDQNRAATEGWWRIYPGYCEVPVDLAMLKGKYYVHAEANPRSTMPNDRFTWGDDKELCVEQRDFRAPSALNCDTNASKFKVKFNVIEKNWRNLNRALILHPDRGYEGTFRTRVAGVQRLLSVIGYDVGQIDGVLGEKTVTALNEISRQNQLLGFDFKAIYPVLEAIIAERQKLDK